MATSTTVNAACACNSFSLQITISNSELPFKRALCMCDTCRRVTGSCGISSIGVPKGQIIDPTKLNVNAYSTSEAYNRYFCSTCGAHVLLHCLKDNSWHVPSGILDRTEGIIKWMGSEWVEDTLDGGIGIWLGAAPDFNGQSTKPKRWRQDIFLEDFVPETEFRALTQSAKTPDILEAQCHCGGVKFHITRPKAVSQEEFSKVASPFPDLMVPYNSNISAANPNNEHWWLRANETKYFAGLCTCTSCRLNSGFEIQPWAFVPKCNILQEDGTPMDFKMGTLKCYPSSEGVWREWCSVCGATVFWHCAERPLLIDVSVGLLDPAEGARAENWLEWNKARVSFREMTVSESLVASLEAGLAKS